MNIGVIFPSRGLCFSETVEELLTELSGIPHEIYFSHSNGIPDCFNLPLERALKKNHTHIWIVEDDMVLSKGILKEMLDKDTDIVMTNCPTTDKGDSTVLYSGDDVLFSGTGCMLVKTEVFRKMPKPIFRTDIEIVLKVSDGKLRMIMDYGDPQVYGHQDINFGIYHYLNQTPRCVTETALTQRRLIKAGGRDNNSDVDKIVLLPMPKDQLDESIITSYAKNGVIIEIPNKELQDYFNVNL